MAQRTNYDVTHVNGHWQGTKEGAKRASVHAETIETAIKVTVDLAKKNLPSSVRIHHMDGTIEDERTFMNDPFPPEG